MAGTSRSGRRRNSAALRELQGSRTRPHHAEEPDYSTDAPLVIPEMVEKDPLALLKWARLVTLMSRSGVLTEAHAEMLGLLCLAWADLERSREQYRAMGHLSVIVETGGDRPRIRHNPLVSRIEKLSYQCARYLGEFGLTPMTSAKVAVEKALEETDPFAEFLQDDDQVYGPRHTQ